jgi:hypothetical protein
MEALTLFDPFTFRGTKMALPKLNGWRRLWIVVAVITFFWATIHAIGKAATSRSTDYEVIAALKNPECEHIRKLPKDSLLEHEPEYGSACYALYSEKKFSDTPIYNVKDYQAIASKMYRSMLLSWLAVSLTIWAVSIVLLYGAGATIAWIIRGFKVSNNGG